MRRIEHNLTTPGGCPLTKKEKIMNKSLLLGIALGVGGAAAGGAVASYAVFNRAPAQVQSAVPDATPASAPPASSAAPAPLAEQPQIVPVLAVTAITETTRSPQQQCHNVTVTHRRPVQDEHRIAGTVIGGALGGAIGNQVGKGHGRDAARVVGILAGGYAGNRVQKNLQESDTYTTTEQKCSTVARTRTHTLGYDVTFKADGALRTVRMNKHPGDRLLLSNGEVVPLGRAGRVQYD